MVSGGGPLWKYHLKAKKNLELLLITNEHMSEILERLLASKAEFNLHT